MSAPTLHVPRLLVSLTPNPAHQRINIPGPRGAPTIHKQGGCRADTPFRYLAHPIRCISLPPPSSSSHNFQNNQSNPSLLNLTHSLSLSLSPSFPSLTQQSNPYTHSQETTAYLNITIASGLASQQHSVEICKRSLRVLLWSSTRPLESGGRGYEDSETGVATQQLAQNKWNYYQTYSTTSLFVHLPGVATITAPLQTSIHHCTSTPQTHPLRIIQRIQRHNDDVTRLEYSIGLSPR